jgi:hypothetical protein
MTILASSIITTDVLIKVVVGALAAGLGVTIAFSALIYCLDRVRALRTSNRAAAARAFQAASVLALSACLAVVAYGLILTVSKPK